MESQPNYSKRAIFDDLGYRPHAGQIEIHKSKALRRIVGCGVRWGKTKCAAMEGIGAALMPSEHSIGWIVAPTYDLCDRVFREIQVTLLEKLRHRIVLNRESDRRIVLRNLGGGLSEIKAKSADNPVSLLGEGLDWLVCDEASRLKPTIWQGHLTQRLVDKKGWALLISTPRGRGYFHDLYRRGQGVEHDPDYASWNFPSWTNPLLDAAVIEQERERLPERVFRQEFAAEFIEGSGAVFHNVRECAVGSWQEPQPGVEYLAGLDLAKVEDFTVLVVINRKCEVVYMDRFHRIDWLLQVARIEGAVRRFNNARIYCDVTGVGDPIYEQLCRAGLSVEPYPFTARSKADLISNLALMIEQRRVVLPTPEIAPELIDELESFQYSVTDAGNIRSSAPAGQHDDAVVSLGLACWPVRKPPAQFYFKIAGPRTVRTPTLRWRR